MNNEDVSCSKCPNATHGFDRNASHNSGRYVCECESHSCHCETLIAEAKEQGKSEALEQVRHFVSVRDERDNLAERTASLTAEVERYRGKMIANAERSAYYEQQNAELAAEVEYWKNIRTENAVYFEKREAELTTHRDILTHELNYARERFNKAIRVLSGIHSLLYPPHFTDKDGKVLAFKSPIAEEHIQALSDKIRAIPDDISAIDAAIANCKEPGK